MKQSPFYYGLFNFYLLKENNYIPQITFVRFLAASLVVFYHYTVDISFLRKDNLGDFISEGAIAVSFFFFLSGLVLSINYLKDEKFSAREFLIKRVARIYPIYLIAFLTTLFLTMILSGAYPKGLSVIFQLLSLHAWYPGMCLEINFPGWSISVEMFFYLVFPLFILLFRRISVLNASAFVIAIWVISQIAHVLMKVNMYEPGNSFNDQLILYFPLLHLNTFLFGMLGGMIFLRLKEKTIPSHLPIIVSIAGILFFLYILTSENIIRPFVHNGLLSPLFLLILLGLALDRTRISGFTGSKPLVFLGDISYSIYILQFPVYLIYVNIVCVEKLDFINFIAYYTFLIAVSSIAFLLIEKNLRKLIVKKILNYKN